MNKLENFINKLNFKKFLRLYLFFSILLLTLCLFAIVYVSKDKIYMAIDYERVSDTFEKEGINDKLKLQLTELASDSKDIKNIIILDKNNNIVFRVNNNLVGNKTKLQFTPYEFNRKYLQDNINRDVLYKVVKKEDIILNKDYIKNSRKIELDIYEEFSFERDLAAKEIYLLNYIVDKDTANKLFIIRTVNPIPYGERLLEITGIIIGLIIIIYWLGLALWVYKDASKKLNNPSLWGLIVLLTNLLGLIIYTMFKQNNKICYKCGFMQSKENIYCTKCGTRISRTCNNCGNIIQKYDKYCSKCGNKLL
ncbi:hypothetical protein TR13x_05895 [Caloranaerobacter sp. TR13]|uniref:zinc ribbon domain-containing protein n=1 Tax=Caloranaerobacter sp. TR13 TaxID=1302151 RepID=UPI0006D3D067|nr:zinc ribbon domain-containing protein [Caloranaerobacter sp. TR13]KPU27277.1 hypothetical protein TR13x_05895 [Caloranaerobacter sp. TR13]